LHEFVWKASGAARSATGGARLLMPGSDGTDAVGIESFRLIGADHEI
jgi:hypothetical protein